MKNKANNYINRELSWINFNKRVLLTGMEKTYKVLDKVKFCSIFSNNLDDVYRYNIALDQWTQLNPFPGGGRGYGYGVYQENDAYLGFGSNNNVFPTDWWHFNMNNEQWTQLASFPGTGRNHPAMILANNKIFVGLGSNSS